MPNPALAPPLLRLTPLVPAGGRPGPALRVVEAPGQGVEVGLAVPGHADHRGGVTTAAELFAWAQEIARFASRLMTEEWAAVQAVPRTVKEEE